LKAIILAAGEGSRMRPLTYTRPKVMLPIANKPILEHLLVEASQAGIREFIFIVEWGVNIVYCNQRKQLGTADALNMAAGLVDGNFLVMNGDIIVNQKDIKTLAGKSGNTLSVIEVSDTTDLGMVELSKDRVVRIYEKVKTSPSHTANAGVYLFTPEIFSAISMTSKSPRGEYEITDSLQLMIDKGHRVSYQKIDYWLDLSYPWHLLTANESLLAGIESENLGEVEENVVIKEVVSIGKNTIVRSGSYIVGPVIIGQNCEIGPNCYIRPHTAIGDSCHIGNAVEVKSSIIMRGSKIPHHNYVGDSIIGEECNFGAGTKRRFPATRRSARERAWRLGLKPGAAQSDRNGD
jgi:bifunctional UDP-N-acetylglucosamine pyrophosphorylase/glucosamine-1-phosphate N-acetyltransferase